MAFSGSPVALGAIPSIAGDAPALLNAEITVGSQVPTAGRVVGLAALPHPSYAVRYPAASIGDRMAGAALTGASGAAGSQYLALPISPTAMPTGCVAKVPLSLPTVYAGRNRVLALARGQITGGVRIQALDAAGVPLGPTAIASQIANWGLIDLGVLSIDRRLPNPTAIKIGLAAGAVAAASPGADAPPLNGSPALLLNEVWVIPEESSVLFVEPGASQIAADEFERSGNLAGSLDAFAHAWATARSGATLAFTTEPQHGGEIPGGQSVNAAAIIDGVEITEARHTAITGVALANASGRMMLSKEAGASSWVEGMFRWMPSAGLELRYASGAPATTLASRAITQASVIDGLEYEMTFTTDGGRAAVSVRPRTTAAMLASAGASDANFAALGNPRLAAHRGANAGDLSIRSYQLYSLATNNLAPADTYNLDDVTAKQSWRQAAGGDLTAVVTDRQRGAIPRLSPATAAVAAFAAPLCDGPANDTISVQISVREQFRFAQ